MLRRLGVEFVPCKELNVNLSLSELRTQFEIVVLSVGLGLTPEMSIEGEQYVIDGLQYVEDSKLGNEMAVAGPDVVVIGAGNTAIDCATIARRMGAERVTILYRRTENEMTAYPHEYEFAKREGILFSFLTQPTGIVVRDNQVIGVRCVRMSLGTALDASGRLLSEPVPESEFMIPANQVVKAVGQIKPPLATSLGLQTERGFIAVNANYETSMPGLFAIGDCVRSRGAASTVMAVQDGKLAAAVIHQRLGNEVMQNGEVTYGQPGY
jgi:dihydropyrimidine dehydrogenase (NAD+) subunit PreT